MPLRDPCLRQLRIVDRAGGLRNQLRREARRQLVRRFAALALLAESMEARLAAGERIDLEAHCTISSTLVRIAARLGIERRAKEIPHLKDYLADHAPPERAAS